MIDNKAPVAAPVDPELEEDDEPLTEEDTVIYETMVAGLREHVFGAAEEGIRESLRNSQDIPRDIGSMTLPLVMEAGKQAAQEGIEADFDLLSAIATEVIDDLFDIAEAMGVVDEVTDDDRKEAMYAAIMGYLSTADVPEEELALAQEQLRVMKETGDFDETAEDLKRMGEAKGVDPFASEEQPAPQPQRPSMMGV